MKDENNQQSDNKVKDEGNDEQLGQNDQTIHPIKALLIFQVKLAFDALRDILLSPVALVATVVDLIEGRKGKQSYFAKLMQLGRISERHINLFGQYGGKSQTVDSVLQQVEAILVKEYKEGDISAKAKSAIEEKLRSQFKKNT